MSRVGANQRKFSDISEVFKVVTQKNLLNFRCPILGINFEDTLLNKI